MFSALPGHSTATAIPGWLVLIIAIIGISLLISGYRALGRKSRQGR